MSDALPILLVHLDNPDTGAVSFKCKGIKGARWKTARDIYDAGRKVEGLIADPHIIDYVQRKD